jgi:hypothetical protein
MRYVKAIAVFQILGGLHGLTMLISNTSFSQDVQDTNLIVYILFILLLFISLISGVLLFLQKKIGFILSAFVHLLQIVRFTFGPVNYGLNILASFGIIIEIAQNSLRLGIDVEFLKSYMFLFTNFVYKFNLYLPFSVILNISALLCFMYLCFLYDQVFPRKAGDTWPGEGTAAAAKGEPTLRAPSDNAP